MSDLREFVRPCRSGEAKSTHYLYALVDSAGNVIYVGRTASLARRIYTHRSTKSWWPDVADVWAIATCCLDDTSAAELRAIRSLRPIHNIDPKDSAAKGHRTRRARRLAGGLA